MRSSYLAITAVATVLALGACSSDSVDQGNVTSSGRTSDMAGGRPQSQQLTAAERMAQIEQELQAQVGDRVFFGTDAIDLNTQARQTLERQVAFLKRYPDIRLQIQGHADERGTREYNLALGDRRANSVKEFFLANGISSARLATVSYGKERPEGVGANEDSWARNRRAVSVIVK
jgi:peptidoglycan-associated lipoprotein